MQREETNLSVAFHPVIASRNVTQHILRAFNLRAVKKLGQNFLIDESIVHGIVKAAEITSSDRVLEIGPGIGTLTQALLEEGAEVTAVELDKKLPAVLKETLKGYERFCLVEGDILKTDITAIMGTLPFKVVANLPYYITTPILMSLLEQQLPITSITVMVQKEVADRMIAKPGTKAYGSLSVAVQYYAKPQIALSVSPNSFLPEPDVESAVVVCHTYTQPVIKANDTALFFRVVKGAFGQRRKTLLNALQGVGFIKDDLVKACEASNIDWKRRGETLSIQEFALLANEIKNAG